MATLSVGSGQTYTTIAAAVAASVAGDTINVQGGPGVVYTNDFFTIRHDLTIQAVGGEAKLVATVQPPDGKAYITEGAAGIHVTLSGLDVSGVAVADHNGAAVRYEGGSLSLIDDYFHDNQEGLLGAPDPNGSISIDQSEFGFNGDGSGSTHDIYVGAIGAFSLTNSYVHDALAGHEVKSRAANNTITNNRIFDNTSNASYTIDLPNAGNATISGNLIEQGPNSPNRSTIAYGEEGASNPGTSVSVANNTIVDDRSGGWLFLNRTTLAIPLVNNAIYGSYPSEGPVAESGTTILVTRPALDLSPVAFVSNPIVVTPPPPPPLPPPPPPPPPPIPTMTLDQYHAAVMAAFTVWAPGHLTVANAVAASSVLFTEYTSTTVLGAIKGDQWSHF